MKRQNLVVITFSLMSFVMAMTAFVFGGILDQVAKSLDVTVAKAGLLNTMYSYGAAFGAPIALIVFRKIERSRLLKWMLVITMVMSCTLVLVPNFNQLLIVRLIMGISASSYSVLAIASVIMVADQDKKGRAVAFLIMGSSLALVIGVPLTRFLSIILDWRGIFWILNLLMLFSLFAFVLLLPKGDHESTRLKLQEEIQYFRDGRTVLIFIYTLLMFVGYSAFYTYITPYLLLLFPTIKDSMSYVLIALGVSSFLGNSLGGHVSDRIGYRKAMLIGGIAQMLFAVLILVSRANMWWSIIMSCGWIASAWFTGLQLNTGVSEETKHRSSFMLSINSSAIQMGSAIGASIAAVIITKKSLQEIIFILIGACIGITLIQVFSFTKFQTHSSQINHVNHINHVNQEE